LDAIAYRCFAQSWIGAHACFGHCALAQPRQQLGVTTAQIGALVVLEKSGALLNRR
jgi:hypothetical protein